MPADADWRDIDRLTRRIDELEELAKIQGQVIAHLQTALGFGADHTKRAVPAGTSEGAASRVEDVSSSTPEMDSHLLDRIPTRGPGSPAPANQVTPQHGRVSYPLSRRTALAVGLASLAGVAAAVGNAQTAAAANLDGEVDGGNFKAVGPAPASAIAFDATATDSGGTPLFAFGLSAAGSSAGVSASGTTTGVYGSGATGVSGLSASGVGVAGRSEATAAENLLGSGVAGISAGGGGSGVSGYSSMVPTAPTPPLATGVYGHGDSYGLWSEGAVGAISMSITGGDGLQSSSYADPSRTTLGAGTGVSGSSGSGIGAQGASVSGFGVSGFSTGSVGVRGETAAATASGVHGIGRAAGAVGVHGAGGQAGIRGESPAGIGVDARSAAGIAVRATGPRGIVVSSATGVGVDVETTTGIGVHVLAGDGLPVSTTNQSAAHPAISASNTLGGPALRATSISGYGAVFTGGRAPLRLTPAAKAGHPRSGAHQKGELVVDRNGTLYLCTAGGRPGRWRRVTTTAV